MGRAHSFVVSLVALTVLLISSPARADLAFSLHVAPDATRFNLTVTSSGSPVEVLQSGSLFVQLYGRAAPLVLLSRLNTTGFDSLGRYERIHINWGDAEHSPHTTVYSTRWTVYRGTSDPIIVFSHSYPRGAAETSTGNEDGVASSFPSLQMANPDIGFVHFSGFMAGSQAMMAGLRCNQLPVVKPNDAWIDRQALEGAGLHVRMPALVERGGVSFDRSPPTLCLYNADQFINGHLVEKIRSVMNC